MDLIVSIIVHKYLIINSLQEFKKVIQQDKDLLRLVKDVQKTYPELTEKTLWEKYILFIT